MSKTKYLVGAGAALSLAIQGLPVPAFAQDAGPQQTTTFQYKGPPILHPPGAKTPTGRPEYVDMRNPEVAAAFFATHGASGVQEIVDASLGECQDIDELTGMIAALDAETSGHEQDTRKIRKDQPKHQTWQGLLTVADAGTQVAIGTVTGGPIGTYYGAGGVIRGVKQLGNERWQGRLDRNYLAGARLQVSGMKVFLASERIYHRHMKEYCPLFRGYVTKYGKQILLTPVNNTPSAPPPGEQQAPPVQTQAAPATAWWKK
ncbi:MAG: hypothetical protein AAB582_02175 [Patescibacteria group bacterium]